MICEYCDRETNHVYSPADAGPGTLVCPECREMVPRPWCGNCEGKGSVRCEECRGEGCGVCGAERETWDVEEGQLPCWECYPEATNHAEAHEAIHDYRARMAKIRDRMRAEDKVKEAQNA